LADETYWVSKLDFPVFDIGFPDGFQFSL